jgi:hypothetical protein
MKGIKISALTAPLATYFPLFISLRLKTKPNGERCSKILITILLSLFSALFFLLLLLPSHLFFFAKKSTENIMPRYFFAAQNNKGTIVSKLLSIK